jgi:hypothetical protein
MALRRAVARAIKTRATARAKEKKKNKPRYFLHGVGVVPPGPRSNPSIGAIY